jgi:amino acid permease
VVSAVATRYNRHTHQANKYSVNRAAWGASRVDLNQNVNAYDRNDDHFYPYKSHGQYLRAWYGLGACFIFALFNGWQSVISPMSPNDFVASYINVSSLLLLG